MQKEGSNVLYIVLVSIAIGVGAGYLLLPPKIIDNSVEVSNYKKTIENLQQQLSKKEKTKTTTLFRDGVITSQVVETQADTIINTNSSTIIEDKEDRKETTHTEINPKRFTVEVGYETRRNYYFGVNVPLYSFISIHSHLSSNFVSNTALGMGIAINF
jgi:hypothetical protein